MFGNPETTTGGRALKFYASVRVEVRRIGAIKDGDTVTGNRTKIKVVKNKVAAPFREVEVDILYGQGVSKEADLLDLAAANSVVEKSGSWYSYHGERIGQGRENARTFLIEHADLAAQMDVELRTLLGLTTNPDGIPSKPAADEFTLKVAQSA
jgi:recombination protein RecA